MVSDLSALYMVARLLKLPTLTPLLEASRALERSPDLEDVSPVLARWANGKENMHYLAIVAQYTGPHSTEDVLPLFQSLQEQTNVQFRDAKSVNPGTAAAIICRPDLETLLHIYQKGSHDPNLHYVVRLV